MQSHLVPSTGPLIFLHCSISLCSLQSQSVCTNFSLLSGPLLPPPSLKFSTSCFQYQTSVTSSGSTSPQHCASLFRSSTSICNYIIISCCGFLKINDHLHLRSTIAQITIISCTIESLGSRTMLGTWLALNKYLLSK